WRRTEMKSGLMKGLLTGMLIGGSAATIFGVMNWQTEKKWNQKAKQTGSWLSDRADDIVKKL
ncbi:MAG: hypothetical protein IJ769_07810, partial [Clostridia bacterium]|nr:hypothetical protein [Clostridia bacterium]